MTLRERLSPPPPSRTASWADARWGDGCEHPDELGVAGAPQFVERSFCFVDLCSFTEYCDTWGPVRATAELDRFRHIVRETAGRRGVRVAKWLGDGAMLVAVDPGPAVGAAVEIVGRARGDDGLSARGGVTSGAALLHDGDDHVGRPVNLAARLCDHAEPDQVLATADVSASVPYWVEIHTAEPVAIRGFAEPIDVVVATADESVSFQTPKVRRTVLQRIEGAHRGALRGAFGE